VKSKRRPDADDDDEKFAASGGPTLIERVLFGKVGTKQLALFYRQFSQYLMAGMDVPQSLKGLQKHFKGRALGPVIARMIDAVKSGRSMAEAFEREPQAFDRLAVNMIRASESRGAVPEILVELAEIQEFRARTVRNMASASIYPIMVMSAAALCLLVIAVFVGPLFNSVLGDMIPPANRKNLILPTQLLFKFNQVMMVMGPLVPIFLLIGSVVGIWLAYKTKTGQTILDEIYWYVPIFGKIQKFVDLSRMGRMLGALLEAGVATPDALALTAGVVRLKPFERALLEAEVATRDGDEIGPVFAASGRFPYEVIGLIETGETTGNLPRALSRMATDYEERATVMIKSLSTLIQPIITVGLGLIVGFIAIAFVGLIAGVFTSLSQGF
jgi:type IV pilus assembly protein PilC